MKKSKSGRVIKIVGVPRKIVPAKRGVARKTQTASTSGKRVVTRA